MEAERIDQREVLDAAMEAGHILLENGAEIFRVEETIDRICRHFGVESENAFVLSNGIFLTAGSEKEKRFCAGGAHSGAGRAALPGCRRKPAFPRN